MSDDITKIIEDIRSRTQSFGAYLHAAQAAVAGNQDEEDMEKTMDGIPDSDELKKKLVDGEVNVVIFTVFGLNEVAFSDRVQNPEKDKLDNDFKTAMPTEFELLEDKIKRRLTEGKGLFDIEDE